jgi:hypothetical protein
MARLPQLETLVCSLGLKLITIADLVSYLRHRERPARLAAASRHHTEKPSSLLSRSL